MMMLLRMVVSGLVIVFCAGFIPVSGCAKGCGRVGRSGASHTDDFARVGTRYGDDIALNSSRYGKYGAGGSYADDLARQGGRYRGGVVVVPGGNVGGMGDDLAHLSRSNLEGSVAALPEGEGAINAIARRPTSSGATVNGLDDAGRNFGKDYAKSVDDLKISKDQHDKLMDAFETAQDIGGEVIDALAEDDDADDPGAIAKSIEARRNLQLVALELEAELAGVLTTEQMAEFRTQFGSSEVVAYRLAKDKPVKRKAKPGKAGAKDAKKDKVAP